MIQTTHDDLNAYVDGELGPDEAAEIEARLVADPEERIAFEGLVRQKTQISEALDALDTGPASLQTERLKRRLADKLMRQNSARRSFTGYRLLRSGTRVAAAGILVAFGWWGHATLTAPATGIPEYVSEAVGAHQVFAYDPTYPVEFAGSDVDGAADWFSSKTGVSVAAPDLAEHGINLVGARLLGTKEGPLAQYIYEDGRGARYSLTLAQHPETQPIGPVTVVDYPDRSVGYWRTPRVDFAFVGEGRSDDVQTIAMDLSSKI